jgi:hypothetical protein
MWKISHVVKSEISHVYNLKDFICSYTSEISYVKGFHMKLKVKFHIKSCTAEHQILVSNNILIF